MSLLQATIFCAIFALAHCWVNDYDGRASFSCPANQYLTRIHSIHSNQAEDRVWDYSCGGNIRLAGCTWSAFANDYDQLLAFTCPDDGILVGMQSIHNNKYEDRVFTFKCCTPQDKRPGDCFTTGYVNAYDAEINVQLPEGQVIKGAYSQHSDAAEDRRWRFYYCTLKNNNQC